MEFEVAAALWAGVIGGLVMAAARMAMRASGVELKMDVARMWGTMIGLEGNAAWMTGMVIHLVVSALIGVAYGWAFGLVDANDQLWLWGLIGGVIHWIIAGVFLAFVPPMHPDLPEEREPPGMFVANYGRNDMVGFLIGHLLYGLTVGIVYAFFHTSGGTEIAF